MQFKTDENLPLEACRMLHESGHDAISVLEQQLGGRCDMDVASVCKAENRIFITLDTDFGNVLAYPPEEFPGIIVVRAVNQSKQSVLTFIRRILLALESEGPSGALWIVEADRIRVRGPE